MEHIISKFTKLFQRITRKCQKFIVKIEITLGNEEF